MSKTKEAGGPYTLPPARTTQNYQGFYFVPEPVLMHRTTMDEHLQSLLQTKVIIMSWKSLSALERMCSLRVGDSCRRSTRRSLQTTWRLSDYFSIMVRIQIPRTTSALRLCCWPSRSQTSLPCCWKGEPILGSDTAAGQRLSILRHVE